MSHVPKGTGSFDTFEPKGDGPLLAHALRHAARPYRARPPLREERGDPVPDALELREEASLVPVLGLRLGCALVLGAPAARARVHGDAALERLLARRKRDVGAVGAGGSQLLAQMVAPSVAKSPLLPSDVALSAESETRMRLPSPTASTMEFTP